MSNLSHAPGPWSIDRSGWKDGQGETIIRDANGWDIAHMYGVWNNAPANEAAVAAAPDLIIAVEATLFAVTADADANDGKVDRAAVAELCRAALKKAGAL